MITDASLSLAERRAAFAHKVTTRFGAHDSRVEAAFGKVPREAFLGAAPWLIRDGDRDAMTRTIDPADLYRDVLVAIDETRGINNGQPSLHAACLAALAPSARDHVLHIGAGTGYYTAILAELAGSVDAYEIDGDLAWRAGSNLAGWPNATVHEESAIGRALPAADAIYVNAGVTHPDAFWLDALRDGGRLLFPLTVEEGWGGMLLVTRHGAHFDARFVSRCAFIPCVGGRDPVTANRLRAVFDAGGRDKVRSLTRLPPEGASVWFAGGGWYLSTEPAP